MTPSSIDPAILEGLEASGRSGLLIAARVVERAGPSQVRVLQGAFQPVQAGPAILGEPATLVEAADANPSDLFFIVNPGGGQAMERAPNQATVEFTFFCNGLPLFDVTVHSLVQEPVGGTGGHGGGHAGEKPNGGWEPDAGNTNAQGVFTTVFTSNVAAGDEIMRLHITANDVGSPCQGLSQMVEALIGVRFQGLARIPASPQLSFGAITSDHSDIFFATPPAIDRVQRAALHFFQLRGAGLRVNAASLVFGGINDINSNWAPPHQFHRIGTDLDLDGPTDSPTIWEQIILAGEAAGFRLCEVHNRNHVHCYGNARAYSTF